MASDFKIFYGALPVNSSSLLPGKFAREKDAAATAEKHTKITGIECFVIKAERVFFAKPDSDSLYSDWDEINRLNQQDADKALADTAPAPIQPPPAIAPAPMEETDEVSF